MDKSIHFINNLGSAKASLFYYCIKLKHPIFIQNKPLFYREGFVLQLIASDGSIGYGDISPLPYLSKETLHQAYNQLKQIDFTFLDKLNVNDLFPSVCFAIQSALSRNLPEKFLIPYCALFMGDAKEILTKISLSKTRTLKIKVSQLSLTEAIKVTKAILKNYPKRTIRIDCNRKWSYEEALIFINKFSATDFEYLEEPCQTKDETIQLAKTTNFPIALDESIYEYELSELKYIYTIIFKPSIIHPPFTQLKKPLVYSSAFESGLGLYHILLQATNHSTLAAGVDTYKYLDHDILKYPILYKNNYIYLKKPVLNIEKLCPVPLS